MKISSDYLKKFQEKAPQKKEPLKFRNERQYIVQEFADRINAERKGTAFQQVTFQQINVKVSHLKGFELKWFHHECLKAPNFSKYFYGKLKFPEKGKEGTDYPKDAQGNKIWPKKSKYGYGSKDASDSRPGQKKSGAPAAAPAAGSSSAPRFPERPPLRSKSLPVRITISRKGSKPDLEQQFADLQKKIRKFHPVSSPISPLDGKHFAEVVITLPAADGIDQALASLLFQLSSTFTVKMERK